MGKANFSDEFKRDGLVTFKFRFLCSFMQPFVSNVRTFGTYLLN